MFLITAFHFLTGIFACSFLVYVILTLRAAYAFKQLNCLAPKALTSTEPKKLPFVSIVIAARNEAEHITVCLQSAAHQDYPMSRYEIILIDDYSTDATAHHAHRLAEIYSHLIVLSASTPPERSSKKAALQQGISRAKGEIILQTDADCSIPPSWIRSMLAYFGPQVHFVSGPVLLTHGRSWLERLQSLEFMGLIALGAGNMAAGTPNMCNGANMAFRRQSFLDIGQHTDHIHIASGDDELLLQKFSRYAPYGIRFAKCQQAIITTPALSNWKSVKAQRIRWVSKARYYSDRSINMVQIFYYLAFLLFPTLLLQTFFHIAYFWAFLSVLGIKCLVDSIILTYSARFFRKLDLLWYLIPLEILYVGYVIWIGIAGNRINTYSWKGRTVS